MKLKALILNCTLKYSPEKSHTQALIGKVIKLYEKEGEKKKTKIITKLFTKNHIWIAD